MGGLGKNYRYSLTNSIRHGKMTLSTCKHVEEGTVKVELLKRRNKMHVLGSKLILEYNFKEFQVNLKLNIDDDKKLWVKRLDPKFSSIGPISGDVVESLSTGVVIATSLDYLNKFIQLCRQYMETEKPQENKEKAKEEDLLPVEARLQNLENGQKDLSAKIDSLVEFLRGKAKKEGGKLSDGNKNNGNGAEDKENGKDEQGNGAEDKENDKDDQGNGTDGDEDEGNIGSDYE